MTSTRISTEYYFRNRNFCIRLSHWVTNTLRSAILTLDFHSSGVTLISLIIFTETACLDIVCYSSFICMVSYAALESITRWWDDNVPPSQNLDWYLSTKDFSNNFDLLYRMRESIVNTCRKYAWFLREKWPTRLPSKAKNLTRAKLGDQKDMATVERLTPRLRPRKPRNKCYEIARNR